MTKTDYTSDIVAFFRDLYPLPEGKPIIPPFLEAWLYTAFPLTAGDPVERNVLHSTSKKQGKSALAGMVALYMAARKRGAEVVIVASDLDQARDRVFRSAKFAVENCPAWQRAKVYRDVIELDQGSTITALPFDWKGAAGSNHSCVILDELHTYTFENQRRLFDELIIPPTISAGVRWIASYAGFEGESLLLREIWDRALQGEQLQDSPPVYRNRGAGLLAMIDQGAESWRMPWSTPEYMAQVRASERPNTYARLWLNQWVSSESQFITPELWQACESAEVRPLAPGDNRRVVLGADASTSRDFTALVGVAYDTATKLADVVYTRVWRPERGLLRLGKPTVDLTVTIGAEILRIHKAGRLQAVYYDPYQLHALAVELEKAGVRMIELPQTAARVEADTALYDAIIGRSLRHYGEPTLSEHIQNAVAVETARGYRLAKEKTSKKIDAAVALSMAHFGALQELKAWGDWEALPNLFYEYAKADGSIGDLSDFALTGSRWQYLPDRNRAAHPPGVTWENCTKRNRGCEACIAELTAAGYYDQIQAEEQLRQNHIVNYLGR